MKKIMKRIWFFIVLIKPINIDINLFLFNLKIQIPNKEHDNFTFSFCILPLITFAATSCYGAGWGITFYKWRRISIHLKRMIIGIDFGINWFVVNDYKFHWNMSKLANKSKDELKKFEKNWNEIFDATKTS